MPIKAGMKAKEDPRNAGTFAPVIRMYKRVPVPAVNSAEVMLSPVNIGTSTVAPNMAKTCWMLSGTHRDTGGLSAGM